MAQLEQKILEIEVLLSSLERKPVTKDEMQRLDGLIFSLPFEESLDESDAAEISRVKTKYRKFKLQQHKSQQSKEYELNRNELLSSHSNVKAQSKTTAVSVSEINQSLRRLNQLMSTELERSVTSGKVMRKLSTD